MHSNREILERLPKNDKYMSGLVTGFSMGEGCFAVCKRKGKDKIYLSAEFRISLKKEDKFILYKIRNFLKCGRIYFSNKAVTFAVTKLVDLVEVIIPFFDHYPMINVKKNDYEKFKIICYKMWKGEGKTKEGLERILSVRELLNNGGYNRTFIHEYEYIGLL